MNSTQHVKCPELNDSDSRLSSEDFVTEKNQTREYFVAYEKPLSMIRVSAAVSQSDVPEEESTARKGQIGILKYQSLQDS